MHVLQLKDWLYQSAMVDSGGMRCSGVSEEASEPFEMPDTAVLCHGRRKLADDDRMLAGDKEP